MTVLEIIFITLLSPLFLMLILSLFYDIWGFNKWFYHDILGWHKPNKKQSFDGCSFHATCKHCGKRIMQDSQGNWFEY